MKYEERRTGQGGRGAPRRQDHLSRPGAGHGKAERVQDGVESIDADRNEHERRRPRRKELDEPDAATQERREDPPAGHRLTEDERHRQQGEKQVDEGERYHEVVGGRLKTPTAMHDETGQDVADDRRKRDDDEDDALNDGRRHRR